MPITLLPVAKLAYSWHNHKVGVNFLVDLAGQDFDLGVRPAHLAIWHAIWQFGNLAGNLADVGALTSFDTIHFFFFFCWRMLCVNLCVNSRIFWCRDKRESEVDHEHFAISENLEHLLKSV